MGVHMSSFDLHRLDDDTNTCEEVSYGPAYGYHGEISLGS